MHNIFWRVNLLFVNMEIQTRFPFRAFPPKMLLKNKNLKKANTAYFYYPFPPANHTVLTSAYSFHYVDSNKNIVTGCTLAREIKWKSFLKTWKAHTETDIIFKFNPHYISALQTTKLMNFCENHQTEGNQ